MGEENADDGVIQASTKRFTWLLVNLGTAILASLVIGMFDATLEQMVALAVLMPIVASMGGNAGTQTLTITVRALAMKDLTKYNAFPNFSEGVDRGFSQRLSFCVFGRFDYPFWFSHLENAYLLGAIIAFAMIINLVVAGVSGVALPILLEKMKVDPAVASGVFVTTITDVVGFLAFLGLASIFLL